MRSFFTYPYKKYIITVTVKVKIKFLPLTSSLEKGLGHIFTGYIIPVEKYF